MEILGSGTSHGIPVIGCDCAVCHSNNPKDNRMRASALIHTDDGMNILIDAGPEFRMQALRSQVSRIDALLVTHPHADHIHGIDDLRIFTYHSDLPVYSDNSCITEIRNRFDYAFKETQKGGGKPRLKLTSIGSAADTCTPFNIGSTEIIPIPVYHGLLPILGWRIGDTAYLTDTSRIPETSFDLLKGVRNLVIDALRERTHPTHFSFSEALEAISRINPENAWFTHICHDFSHEMIREWLANNEKAQELTALGKKIEPAYDGLQITIA